MTSDLPSDAPLQAWELRVDGRSHRVEVLDKAKYVWPIVLAYVLAKAEINRRRKQDALRAELRQEREERKDDET
ncbi:MAG: hypothetical protein Q8O61_12470 [Nocardioides sp.]|nr:hypothetical protein [Nocardioides sp.]